MKRRIIFGIIIVVIGFLSITTNLLSVVESGSSKESAFMISRFAFWILLIFLFLYVKKIEKTDFLLIAERKHKWWFYPVAIISVIVIVAALLNFIRYIETQIGYPGNDKGLNLLREILCGNKLLLVFTCLTAAVTEELFFRGYLLSRMKVLTNSNWMAVVISALLFGLAHFGFNDFNRMFYPFVIGLIFGTFYVKYKSITALILIHLIIDLNATLSLCS